MFENNVITYTDSYKLFHHKMYPADTKAVYSYFESRIGARWNETVFFGLQALIDKHLRGKVVTEKNINAAKKLFAAHVGPEAFNEAGWRYILNRHNGYLPLCIKAVPEGTPVKVSNIMMSVQSTDDKCGWLTNYVESLLTHVWYPSTVATLSRETKKLIKKYAEATSDAPMVDFMLHDFGYRGVSSNESAEFGGAAHLVNFKGTDTVPALNFIAKYYGEPCAGVSVAASEHSVLCSNGMHGETEVVGRLLEEFPKGILSLVADTYDIYNFVSNIIGHTFKDQILARDGVVVIRPDSVTKVHPDPASQVVWILSELAVKFGATVNSKGFKVINPKVRVLWGDGLDFDKIDEILFAVQENGFSVENIATFGMGGGLLQRCVNRDTQRFAFKASAINRAGTWHEIYKKPLDQSKASKKGRFKLVWEEGAHGKEMITVPIYDPREDIMKTVFFNGKSRTRYTFEQVRQNAAI